MLRNRLLPLQHATIKLQLQRAKSNNSAASSNATRQSKILGKLFGSRVAGTKKRWYPSHEATTGSGGSSASSNGSYQPPSVVFQASQFGKSSGNGSKQNTRRMSVLNKLFMTHITDLLATGEAADTILGRGLQVSRVKISSDFSCVNVYWMGNDATLETELQRSSGRLRHELSQLRLMGEVPRIKFVRDKTGSNINNVENILRTLNLKPVEEEEEEEKEQQQEREQDHSFDVAQTARQEFYGNVAMPTTTAAWPEMRHDVLGLDHRRIMDKIWTKMRKTKQAWEQHQQQQQQQQNPDTAASPSFSSSATTSPELLRLQQQMSQAATETSQHKFEAFLAKRRERKQTPERKKHRRDDDDFTLSATLPDYDDWEQRERNTQDDYILEDDKDNKPHNYRNS
ncbi:putative ribosome-binding factor A, mitochondrial [Drosophila innubila]|uniref:putative ribosome-binding factor A, mitochondrial n=1 Tax=Drosophila innubila TaxID=198719 RepID=UPI00148E22CD|nr:putative ribosome-binding factor A, mitochondrial [Drosophila innubila]